MTQAWSAGWRSTITLGDGQERIRARLADSIRHPSRSWHDFAPMRSHGLAPATVHRHVHRLAALGVIAVQTRLGCAGGVRFTFGVRYWRRSPIRRGSLARMTPRRRPAPGQIESFPAATHPPVASSQQSPGFDLEIGPGDSFAERMAAAGFVPPW